MLLAKLIAIYHDLPIAIDMGIDDLTCYAYFVLSINLIKENTSHYHVYVVLIQNIKALISWQS